MPAPTEAVLLLRTPFGWLAAAFRDNALARLSLGHSNQCEAFRAVEPYASSPLPPFARDLQDRLQRYFAGEQVDFDDFPVQFPPPRFTQKVLVACRRIPFGHTQTYGELARQIGRPQAARAVGQALARNPIPIVIPCHRVLPASGRIGGFTAPGGPQLKRKLLELERAWATGASQTIPHGST